MKKTWVYYMIQGIMMMFKSKRHMVQKHGIEKKYHLPTRIEWIMILIFMSVVWFGWGQFQF